MIDNMPLALNKQTATRIFNSKPSAIRLAIPVSKNKAYKLLLARESINSSGDFSFGTIFKNINTSTSYDAGLHYRGCVAGDISSLACIRIFENGEIMGVFANSQGNFNIGKMQGVDSRYIVYKSGDMLVQPAVTLVPCTRNGVAGRLVQAALVGNR